MPSQDKHPSKTMTVYLVSCQLYTAKRITTVLSSLFTAQRCCIVSDIIVAIHIHR